MKNPKAHLVENRNTMSLLRLQGKNLINHGLKCQWTMRWSLKNALYYFAKIFTFEVKSRPYFFKKV